MGAGSAFPVVLGEAGQLEGRSEHSCGGFVARSNHAATESSERVRVAEWQRQPTACQSRKNVSGHRERVAMAKSSRVVRFGAESGGQRSIRGKNERAIRICAS